MLVITTYLVNHSNRLSPNFTKMCLKDKQTATKEGMS